MAKRRNPKKVSTSHVGKAIKLAIKQLKGARKVAGPKGKKHIDLNVKVLNACYDRIITSCKESWTAPKPGI